jgi:hypothetical protein
VIVNAVVQERSGVDIMLFAYFVPLQVIRSLWPEPKKSLTMIYYTARIPRLIALIPNLRLSFTPNLRHKMRLV